MNPLKINWNNWNNWNAAPKEIPSSLEGKPNPFAFPLKYLYFPEKGCHLGTNRSDNET